MDHLTGLVGERVFYLVRDTSEKVQNYQQISCVQTKDSQESSSNSYSHSSDGERSMSDTSMISEASFSLGQYGCVFVRMCVHTVAISYNTAYLTITIIHHQGTHYTSLPLHALVSPLPWALASKA